MSQTAKMKNNKKIVYFVLYEGVQLLDVAGAAEVLSEANRESDGHFYDLRFVGNTLSGSVRSSAALNLSVAPLPKKVSKIHSLIIPGADFDPLSKALEDAALMSWIKVAIKKSKRVISICSGAFFLGRLGLLDGRDVTTHWRGIDQLQIENPKAMVKEDILYTMSSDLWTSAGVLSGIDMTLALVSRDVSATIALKIARNLVVYLFREGGQSQFSGPINLQAKAGESDLLNLISWLEGRLAASVSVEDMALFMNLSIRSLHRKCQDTFTMTPGQILSEMRLELGRTLLVQPDLAIKAIAIECGFSHSAAFSKAFNHRYGIAPKRYRIRFGVAEN